MNNSENFICITLTSEAYSEPCETSKIELPAKLIDEWQQCTSFAKILVYLCSKAERYNGKDPKGTILIHTKIIPWNFTFLILRFLELFPRKVGIFLKK